MPWSPICEGRGGSSHGLPDEGEDVLTHVVTLDRLMVATGEIVDAPLILSAFWLLRNRSRVRAQAGVA